MAIVDKIHYIADTYGEDKATTQLIEEAAELIQAINKVRRVKGYGAITDMMPSEAFGALLEEIADVEICLEEIKHLLDIEEIEVSKIKAYKVVRELDRINEEKGREYAED